VSEKPPQNSPLLLLIDGSNLAFRMFFALEMSNLRNSQGEATWAIFGTLRAVFDLIELAKPSAMAAAFDLPQPSFRHESFDDYKANRPEEMPDELKNQWDSIKDCFRYLHSPLLEEPGLEADDMIGIMARKAEREGYRVIILSGDKDLYQLVSEQIKIAVPQRGGGIKFVGIAEVIEEFGVQPQQVPDYKGIAGDSSDNIPGVKGLGPKAACKLLSDFADMDEIYKNISKVQPIKIQEKLIEQEDSARMSKYLATIITDESILKESRLDLEACKLTMPDLDPLVNFLKTNEFSSILRKLPIVLKPFNEGALVKVDVGDIIEPEIKKDYESKPKKNAYRPDPTQDFFEKPLKDLEHKTFILADEQALNSFVKKLEKLDKYSIDLETDSLNALETNIVGWAFGIKELDEIKTFYIPVRHQNLKQLDPDLVLRKLKPILEDSSKLQIIQNAKFERKIFKKLQIPSSREFENFSDESKKVDEGFEESLNLHDNFYDTMLASYVDNPSNKHGLKSQSKRVFQLRMKEIEDLIGTGKKQITVAEVPIEDLANYAGADAFITYKLYEYYEEKLDLQTKKLLKEIEFKLVDVLVDIESSGVNIDTEILNNLANELEYQILDLESVCQKISAEVFNLASPKQLSNILFSKLGIKPLGKKTKTGAYSTNEEALEDLLLDGNLSVEQSRFIESILKHRTFSKLQSTYVKNLPSLLSKRTGRIHSELNQVVTSTGRLSSSNPNLQNIPIRNEYGQKIRKAFIAYNPDDYLLSADYSQIELRVLADMAEEKKLIEAFQNNEDIHKKTAMAVLDLDAGSIGPDERRIGKTLNFALIYMQGPFSTAKQLGISLQEAKSFIDKYFQAFPRVKPFMEEILESARRQGYVETKFFRRRYFQNINSPNNILRKEEERQAFNAVLQGTAADIMKKAMIDLYVALKNKNYKTKIIMQVHDELLLNVPREELDLVEDLTRLTMENVTRLKVPLLVDIDSSYHWS
jgi:DNA polymerase I